MTPEDFLSRDNSYLVVPRINKWRNLAFWKCMKKRNQPVKMAGSIGNQREAYEAGIKIGWEEGLHNLETSFKVPNNMNLSDKDYQDIMSLLSAFGYQFFYSCSPQLEKTPARHINYGLNICRNQNAIDAGVVVSNEIKQKVLQVLKENSDPRLWNH